MDPGNFTAEKCKSRTAVTFTPKKQSKQDLTVLSKELEKKGALVNALTPLVLVVKFQGTLVTFYRNGKVVIKKPAKREAEELFRKL